MPLTILRHKDWNVWNAENREIVLRDERIQKEEADVVVDYQRRTNLEKRREMLKQKALTDRPEPPLLAGARGDAPADEGPGARQRRRDRRRREAVLAAAAAASAASKAPPEPIPSSPPSPTALAPDIASVEMKPFSLVSEGHINLFPTEDDFASVLGKEKPKRERETAQFKKLELPGNKDYEADKNKEEQEKLRREGVAPLGLGDYDQRLNVAPWEGKKRDFRGLEMAPEKAEKLRKLDERHKVTLDPMSVVSRAVRRHSLAQGVERHFQEERSKMKVNGPFISNEIQRLHMRHQIDDIREKKREKEKADVRAREEEEEEKAKEAKPVESALDRLRRERLQREERERSKTLRLLTGR